MVINSISKEAEGVGLKFQISHHGLILLVKSPHPEVFQEPTKSHHFKTKDALNTQEFPRDFGALCKVLLPPLSLWKLQLLGVPCQGPGTATKYIYFLLYHNDSAIPNGPGPWGNMLFLWVIIMAPYAEWAFILSSHVSRCPSPPLAARTGC